MEDFLKELAISLVSGLAAVIVQEIAGLIKERPSRKHGKHERGPKQ